MKAALQQIHWTFPPSADGSEAAPHIIAIFPPPERP